jgi:hypothetical protein
LTEWKIPELIYKTGGIFCHFASGKNRRTPGEPLHTIFNLSGDGGFFWRLLNRMAGRLLTNTYYRSQFGLLSYGLPVRMFNRPSR